MSSLSWFLSSVTLVFYNISTFCGVFSSHRLITSLCTSFQTISKTRWNESSPTERRWSSSYRWWDGCANDAADAVLYRHTLAVMISVKNIITPNYEAHFKSSSRLCKGNELVEWNDRSSTLDYWQIKKPKKELPLESAQILCLSNSIEPIVEFVFHGWGAGL